ncbi:MAG: hypothetical protein ABS987_06925, partial [Ruminococcus sp.]
RQDRGYALRHGYGIRKPRISAQGIDNFIKGLLFWAILCIMVDNESTVSKAVRLKHLGGNNNDFSR